MNRDNLLFTVIGLLLGFIGGYVAHEVMAARQPQRLVPGQAAVALPGAPTPGAPAPGPAATPSGPGPQAMAAMERVQQLRAHVEQNPDDRDALLRLANMNYDIRNWSRAAELYQRYLTLAPNSTDVMTDLSLCYRAMGDLDRALALLREVQTLAPEHWQAGFNEAIILAFDQNQLDAAQAKVATLQALQPDNPDVARLASEIERRRSGG